MAQKKDNTNNYLLIGAVVLLIGLGVYAYLQSRPQKIDNEDEVLQSTFDNLTFEFGKSVIQPTSFASLDKLAGVLVKKPDWKLSIVGHTDNKGSDEANLKLSKARAKSVADYLISKGVSGTTITSDGLGESKPIADNNTDAGREKNRRVEFTITKPDKSITTTIK
jgi:outer membrane protein OmpA-like peptidoglycan-associated protein